jgi:hypothetical protein
VYTFYVCNFLVLEASRKCHAVSHICELITLVIQTSRCYQNSTCATAVHVKNRQKTVGIEEKLDVIRQLEKGRIVDICYYVRFIYISVCKIMILLIELKKVLSQEQMCLCSKTTTVLLE